MDYHAAPQYAAWKAFGDELNKTGRPTLYSCSWPDYIRTNSSGTGPVDYRNTAAHCNLWRMYNDIQDSWASVTDIIDWVGDNAPTNGMLDAAGVEEGDTVVVVGDGAVGLCGVLAASVMGAGQVIAMSRHEPRQRIAEQFGGSEGGHCSGSPSCWRRRSTSGLRTRVIAAPQTS